MKREPASLFKGRAFPPRPKAAGLRRGWDVVNMTQYPEAILARELALCYVNIALVTDYDAGVVVPAEAVQVRDVLAVMQQNNANVKNVLRAMLEQMPPARVCPCPDALKYARLE